MNELWSGPRQGALRIRWTDVPHFVPSGLNFTAELLVHEFDEVMGWCVLCPLVDFPRLNPSRVEDLPSATEEELPPWA